jgi:uncharacterized membrane protein
MNNPLPLLQLGPPPFEQWNDPHGNKLIALNHDGTIFCQGVGFVAGGALLVGPVPIVQSSYNEQASTAVVALTFTLPTTTMYMVTLYYGPSDSTGSGNWSPTVSWTDPTGNDLQLAYPFLGQAVAGDPNNLQSYALPFLCKAGTPITIDGAYSGTPFPLNIGIRIVAMP